MQATPMRGAGRLDQLVQELRRQEESRVDFVIDTRDLVVKHSDGQLILAPTPSGQDFLPKDGVPILDQAVAQIAERLTPSMPLRFLKEALKTAPDHTVDFVNDLLHTVVARRFVRVLDGRCRAFLSDRYRVIDSMHAVHAVLEATAETDARIIQASISDSNVRIKLTTPDVQAFLNGPEPPGGRHTWMKSGSTGSSHHVKLVASQDRDGKLDRDVSGDEVWPAVTISNSETGHGGLGAHTGMLTAACYNLATIERAISVVHLGGVLESGHFNYEVAQAETNVVRLKIRDAVKTAFDPVAFQKLVEAASKAVQLDVASPTTALKNVIGVTDAIKESQLDGLLACVLGETFNRTKRMDCVTKLDVAQGVTRYAQGVDPDEAFEMERLGGALLLSSRFDSQLVALA